MDRGREIAHGYADCIVSRNTRQAVDIVINYVPGVAIFDRHRRLNSVQCMDEAGGEYGVRFTGDAFRYMLAEGLVRLHYRNEGPTDFSAVAPLAHQQVGPLDEARLSTLSESEQREVREGHAREMSLRAAAMLGECVARIEPDAVRRVALTIPNSAEEGQALTTLRPAVAACLPPDTTIRLSRTSMRGALLLAYYRLAYVAQPREIE